MNWEGTINGKKLTKEQIKNMDYIENMWRRIIFKTCTPQDLLKMPVNNTIN